MLLCIVIKRATGGDLARLVKKKMTQAAVGEAGLAERDGPEGVISRGETF